MDERIEKYGKYAYEHLYKEDVKDFKLEYPYAYGTINNNKYKIHVDKIIESLPEDIGKLLYDSNLFNNGSMYDDAVEWEDKVDIDNRFLLRGEIVTN